MTLINTNVVASRHIKREEVLLPVPVCHSKTPELNLNFICGDENVTHSAQSELSGRNSFFGGIFCLEYPSRRSEKVNFYFANYRFSFRFVSFHFVSPHFVSQTTVSRTITLRTSVEKSSDTNTKTNIQRAGEAGGKTWFTPFPDPNYQTSGSFGVLQLYPCRVRGVKE